MENPPHPQGLSEEALLSIIYNEGSLSQAESSHLEHCSICQQRLADYRHLDSGLRARIYRSTCPTTLQLSLYCLGTLEDEERIYVAAHLGQCPLCKQEAAVTRQALADFEPFPSDETPLTAIRRIIATLVTPPQRHLVTRRQDSEKGWHRQYEVEDMHLSLHLSRASTGDAMLLGIVSYPETVEKEENFEGILVSLHEETILSPDIDESKSALLSTQVDDIGNFVLVPIPSGNFHLKLHFPDKEVICDNLDIFIY